MEKIKDPIIVKWEPNPSQYEIGWSLTYQKVVYCQKIKCGVGEVWVITVGRDFKMQLNKITGEFFSIEDFFLIFDHSWETKEEAINFFQIKVGKETNLV